MRRLEGLGANTVLEMGMGDDQVGEGCEGVWTLHPGFLLTLHPGFLVDGWLGDLHLQVLQLTPEGYVVPTSLIHLHTAVIAYADEHTDTQRAVRGESSPGMIVGWWLGLDYLTPRDTSQA